LPAVSSGVFVKAGVSSDKTDADETMNPVPIAIRIRNFLMARMLVST
jgi:hypothetical protein